MTNEEMDRMLLDILSDRTLRFSQIQAVLGYGALYRQIDRRLQALRKRGELRFSHGFGWSCKKEVSP